MNKKIKLTAGLLACFCFLFSAAGMSVEKFNKGTVKEDWTDDFPLKNKGRFELVDGRMTLTLTGRQAARYKCSLEGLTPGKVMYFSFYCSGKNIKSKEGFMGYLRNNALKFVTSISPAGSGWRWATGSFDKQLLELYFKVPSDGKFDVFFELRGEAGEVVITEPMILPVKRKDLKKSQSPVAMTVLPTEWLKDSVTLLQDIPSVLMMQFKGDGKALKKNPLHLSIQHPDFVEIIGIEHRWSVKEKNYFAFPQLKCLQNSATKHVYLIPAKMVAGLKKDSVIWDNQLFMNLRSKVPAGAKGKISMQVLSQGKVLASYACSVSSIGQLPKNRKATKKFKVLVGYPHTAESAFPEIRQVYAKFWNSLAKDPESFFIHRVNHHSPEIQAEFRKNFVHGIIIGGTNSLPLFHSLRQMPHNNYPKLLNDAEKVMSRNSRFLLPSVKYVIDDPDNFIWEKAWRDEINYRSFGMLDAVRFICWDFEPSLLNAGFCEENRKWFAQWAKLSSVPSTQEILARHTDSWGKFRRMQNEMLFRKAAQSLKKHFPHLEFRYCSDPLSGSGQPSTWCGNDPRLSADVVEVFQNMPYFSGTTYFDTIEANTRILKKKQFPLIDPSEFNEMFFRKYSAEKVAQNIIATAALNNIGIGFWRKDCFDGSYLLNIAKGFAAVSELEDILDSPLSPGFKAVAQNCLLQKMDDKSDTLLELPNLSKNLRSVLHKKGNAAAAVILNYNERETVIAKCAVPGMPKGKYLVYDVFAKKSYGTFTHAELAKGILVSIPKLQTAALKITSAKKTASAEITQQQLKKQIQKDIAQLKKDQKHFQNIRSGSTEIRWTTLGKDKRIVVRLASGKAAAAIEPDTATLRDLTNTAGKDMKLNTYGDLILEGVRLEKTPKYTLVSAKIDKGTAVLKFDTVLRAEDSTNPQGFPLDGLKISKTWQLKGNRLTLILELENASKKKSPITVQCRLRSIVDPTIKKIKELSNQQNPDQMLLRPGKKIDLRWAAKVKYVPWKSNSINFTDRMTYVTSSNVIAAYFWRAASVLTAEPITEKITLKPGEHQKAVFTIILPEKK